MFPMYNFYILKTASRGVGGIDRVLLLVGLDGENAGGVGHAMTLFFVLRDRPWSARRGSLIRCRSRSRPGIVLAIFALRL